ncbi:MAG TPA: sigma-70 family RNA polymerase sigma factor [Vicinamibacterales bacterium]|nr:sigma-70 family RNA polymerase sigma factor [Vicinamibacterales bacterium]
MQVDVAQLEAHRAPLTGHCYRMLGSAFDAEDAVQETMVRAWQALDRFEGRSSLRTWLYRIATNVCLDALSDRSRRARPMEEGPNGSVEDRLETRERTHWLEPVPEARVLPSDASPFELAALRQSIRLAFVSALQHLPPRQRAALLLSEVLGWSAAEIAECLEMSVAAVNSALQRARATVATRNGNGSGREPLSETQSRLLNRYVDAFHKYDVDALVALLREDATLSMPPFTLWLRGPETIRAWLAGRGAGCRGSRLVPTQASGAPAFAQYRPAPDGGHVPWSLIVLELDGDRIAAWNAFLDTEKLFPLFGLPLRLPPTGPEAVVAATAQGA